MTNPDAAALGKQALRLGLLTEAQLEEAREESGSRNADPEPLLLALERHGYLTPWQSTKLRRGEDQGYFLGGYRIRYKVASGSFGRVFRADDPTTGRTFAIKVLRRRMTEKPPQVELFLREGRVGMTLKHPNIVEVLAVSRDAGSDQYYMVMEFVEGGNLREILQIRKQLSPTETLRILDDATSGLTYAYSRGVTHRDIKLSNLLMASQGSIKLVDFGLARLFSTLHPDEVEEDKDKVDRTVDYAGLERATGVKQGDVRSDIYFLGCVGYHLIAGRSPLELTRNKAARMQKARFDNVPPLRSEIQEIPPSVISLVGTMMALEPGQRYQTPSQLQDAIKAVRRELEGNAPVGTKDEEKPSAALQTLFVVERSTRLQTAMRDGFKKLGYRVMLSADPDRAVDRFRMQPYDALIVDAATVGEDGRACFEQIMAESRKRGLACVGVLFLKEEQASWKDDMPPAPNQTVMTRPVSIKQLDEAIRQLQRKPS